MSDPAPADPSPAPHASHPRWSIRRLAEFLQEADGSFSSMRLAFLIWAIGSFVVWAGISWHTKQLQPLDHSAAAILGLLTTAKVVQRFAE